MLRPATTALLVLLAGLALACGSTVEPSAAVTAASPGAYPLELQLLLSNLRLAADRDAKRRAENSFLDFVELMWPAVDPGQPFVRGNVQEAIGRHLEAVTDGCIKNLLANVPPGSTKTYLVNVFWPAWEWGPRNRPDLRYMAWSYSPELALKANDDCRKIIKHPVYQRFWGDRFKLLVGKSDAKGFYENDKGGWRRSSSIKGAATGFRADRLIWDDPHNVQDADSAAALRVATRWFARTLPTRVRNMSGEVKVKVPFWVRDVHGDLPPDPDDKRPVTASATVGIMQRVHLHDISGIILKNPGLGYEILLIEMRYKGDEHPARKLDTWPKSSIGYKDWRTEIGQLADPIRFPEDEVAKLEAKMISDGGGSDAVAAQLDQWPLQLTGSWFKPEWLPIIEPADVPKDVGNGKRGWDFGGGGKSKKSDPTASARVARGTSDKKFYIWHTAAKRGSPGDQEAFIKQQHIDDPRDVDWSLPEDPGTGKNYANYIKRECSVGRYVTSSPEVRDKVTRAKPVSGQAQIGQVVIVQHPGCEIAKQELVDFPYGEHDDIVDAISRAFNAVIAVPDLPPPSPGWTFDLEAT